MRTIDVGVIRLWSSAEKGALVLIYCYRVINTTRFVVKLTQNTHGNGKRVKCLIKKKRLISANFTVL